ncbi:MAG TPA: acetoacetate--CoA ligase [Thermoleophilaceae bacterium]|nr:acetoacetate--CoA ligase [Thermoleophilaceae bacterium]
MREGTLLWEPSEADREQAELTRYMRWLDRGLEDYHALWRWSVEDIEGFWASIWDYFEVQASQPYERVLGRCEMPGAEWFPGARLNYAEHVFRRARAREAAIVHASELRPLAELSWDELAGQVGRVAAGLRRLGVGPGDRVVAYMPNIPETVAAFLACASIGAVWSSCAPEFGVPTVIDRFKQIEPKVLLAVDGYRYGGKDFDLRERVRELERELASLERTVTLPYAGLEGDWEEVFAEPAGLEFEQLPFDHPLWVLYSSGTTGLPKAIVHGQGGILLEHLKKAHLHSDLSEGDRFFWFTTTGWMMWNFLVGGLLAGATIVLYDGQPDPARLWQLAKEAQVTCFGTSAGFISACMKAGVEPGRDYDLGQLRSVGSTGSPLPAEGFEWIYESVKRDLWLFSTSGGTDLCTAFVGGCPIVPVYAGELQERCLGAKVEAFDEAGRPLVDEVGELVITEPMPSMPLFFWNDPDGSRLRESYFEMYPGIWRHGDWIKITARNTAVIYGRSDSTINRGGVRMGTSEIYSAVEGLPQVLDSLVIDVPSEDAAESVMWLFVVAPLDEQLEREIRRRAREHCSPRHVPDRIVEVAEVPRTLSNKKLEVPVKKILMGIAPERAASRDSLANPAALDPFVELARR